MMESNNVAGTSSSGKNAIYLEFAELLIRRSNRGNLGSFSTVFHKNIFCNL